MAKKSNRYDSWQQKYSFKECELNNEEYGNYLSSYLRSQKKPLVLNLNGSWGTGKTHFLKQMYSDLRFKHEYPVIYIDAWRSDFSNDPLLVLISEFIEQFQCLNYVIDAADKEEKMLKVIAKFSKKMWNMSAIGVGTYLSGKMDNGAMVEAAKTLTFSDTDAVQIGRNLTDNYKAQLSAIEDTKQVLGHYLDYFAKDKRKVFVLVDELDRCRPTYAIEMLETIKHFFSLDNYIFVVATDTDQLSHSINAVYGSNFDGTEYLSRFFNRSAALPEPNKGLFAKLLVKDTLLDERKVEITIFGCDSDNDDFISNTLHQVSVMYNLSLRRMEQVFRKFESCVLYELDTENRYLDHRLLMQLIAEYDSGEFRICYDERKKSKGLHFNIPKELKEKYPNNVQNLMDFIFSIFSQNLEEVTEKADDLYKIKSKYIFSWDFANEFKSSGLRKSLCLKDGLRVLEEQERSYINNPSRQRDQQQVADEVTNIKNLLLDVKRDCKTGDRGLWTRDDYFKAVELSSTITN
ncbi:KAP family P-loop NTPase fold protein [Vibrio sp. MED222]|uniref:KAP family P-loop NTPase fold protein n=1 Tax=Vibrio sp. MED222 TaxID=314290 RepID=UPI000068EA51|nr:P-loop NTPase fold protein [Vibrio sp. MED222]EAQ55520.1 hypothetical protein MED222_08868 [Vibrio sp. MED222]